MSTDDSKVEYGNYIKQRLLKTNKVANKDSQIQDIINDCVFIKIWIPMLEVIKTNYTSKNNLSKIATLILVVLFNACKTDKSNTKESDFSTIENPYLGQKPPGMIPQLFAPDIIQTEHREAEAAFTPDLKEFYFRRRGGVYENNTLVVVQYKNNQWVESEVPPRAGEPFISPDGKILYLGNKYRERINTGWSEVKSLGPMFDRTDWGIMRLTASAKGTYVFDDYKSNDVIRISTIKEGIREEPKLFDKEINTGKWTAHPFIAPEESYLIWDSEKDSGYGDSDLYISFRQKDGSWGLAINLGDKINTAFSEAYGSISPDGKYFFFHRSYGGDTGDIFWVNAQIIETLKPN